MIRLLLSLSSFFFFILGCSRSVGGRAFAFVTPRRQRHHRPQPQQGRRPLKRPPAARTAATSSDSETTESTSTSESTGVGLYRPVAEWVWNKILNEFPALEPVDVSSMKADTGDAENKNGQKSLAFNEAPAKGAPPGTVVRMETVPILEIISQWGINDCPFLIFPMTENSQ